MCAQTMRTSHPQTCVGTSEVIPSVLARGSSDTQPPIANKSAPNKHSRAIRTYAFLVSFVNRSHMGWTMQKKVDKIKQHGQRETQVAAQL